MMVCNMLGKFGGMSMAIAADGLGDLLIRVECCVVFFHCEIRWTVVLAKVMEEGFRYKMGYGCSEI